MFSGYKLPRRIHERTKLRIEHLNKVLNGLSFFTRTIRAYRCAEFLHFSHILESEHRDKNVNLLRSNRFVPQTVDMLSLVIVTIRYASPCALNTFTKSVNPIRFGIEMVRLFVFLPKYFYGSSMAKFIARLWRYNILCRQL
jgi:hypothetical protein